MLWLTARRPKSQEALTSRRSRNELRRVLPRERERIQDMCGSHRAHTGDMGGHAGSRRGHTGDVEGRKLPQKHGGLRRALGESGGHRKNQESTQGTMRGHGESRLEAGGGA